MGSEILLGTEAGLLSIPGISIDKNFHPNPPVIISSLKLINSPDSIIDINQPLTLPWNNSGVTITYASPSYINEKANKYIYFLAGSNQEGWSKPSNANHITFSNLAAGRYTFLVKAVDINGTASLAAASFKIIVLPAYWQTWWSRVLMFLLAAGIIFFVVRKRISNIRKE